MLDSQAGRTHSPPSFPTRSSTILRRFLTSLALNMRWEKSHMSCYNKKMLHNSMKYEVARLYSRKTCTQVLKDYNLTNSENSHKKSRSSHGWNINEAFCYDLHCRSYFSVFLICRCQIFLSAGLLSTFVQKVRFFLKSVLYFYFFKKIQEERNNI